MRAGKIGGFAGAPERSGRFLGSRRRQRRHGGLAAMDRRREIGAPGLSSAERRQQTRERHSGSAASTLVTTSRSGRLDLPPAERLGRCSCASPCSASTVTTISATTMWWTRTGSARIAATIGAGIGEPAGLQHDLGQARLAGRESSAAFVADAAQFRDELAARRAAGSSRRPAPRCRDARPSSASSTGVSAASLTMTTASAEGAGVQLVAQPGGLARAEEAAEDRSGACRPSADRSPRLRRRRR